MNIGGNNFTNFQNVRVKGSGTGGTGGTPTPGVIRFVATSGLESTLSVNTSYQEGNYQWTLPAKSGGLGITGTFAVQLQAVTSFAETAVTVSGIRREDAVICQIQDMGYTVTTGRTQPIITGARPENGYIYLTFYNPTGTATLYSPMVVAYTAFR